MWECSLPLYPTRSLPCYGYVLFYVLQDEGALTTCEKGVVSVASCQTAQGRLLFIVEAIATLSKTIVVITSKLEAHNK